MPTLRHVRANECRICLMTEIGSIAELDADFTGFYTKEVHERGGPRLEGYRVYFFNRLKARKTGIGEGKFLMVELCKILDENGWAVVNTPNPYGPLDEEALNAFYKRFGFKNVIDGLMVRLPKGASDAD